MDQQQFGNIKSSTTTHCRVDLLDYIYRNIEKRKTSVPLTFVDFRKAFHLVHHTTVITKAINLQLYPSLVSWLSNFLSHRSQVVRHQGATSPPQHLTCGVPKGTRMGSLCFVMLINDAMTDTSARWKYVDNTTLAATINNDNPDYSHLQLLHDRLHTWTTDNKVTLNTNKTTVMHIHTSSDTVPPPCVSIDGRPLQVVQSVKLLGLTIDNKLTCCQHVSSLITSATYRLHLLRRLKKLETPVRELASVYSTFILPRLTYASPTWSSSLNAIQHRQLERVQKRAVRLIPSRDRLHNLPGGPPRPAPHHPSGPPPTPPPAIRHQATPPPTTQNFARPSSSPSPPQCPTPQQAAPHTSAQRQIQEKCNTNNSENPQHIGTLLLG
ncbi:RNA-binding protein 12-like [Eriocheir sinensis]|uniref:RNA-binding protein 12-like n=1 Tax=Eriocheir sinensis TaxID=95602 RepID=UPI0021C593DF|nr:RNA-binding protein 12-like [Eriocheir sinensis]